MPNQNQGGVNPIQAQKFLKGVDYPASKDELIKKARDGGADERVIDSLKKMRGDRFQTPADVSQALGTVS